MSLLPFTLMAFLVRRPNTHLVRLMLIPILIATALRAAFGYVWVDPRLNVYNWGGGACIAFTVTNLFSNRMWQPSRRSL
jgi:hypothetical protein